MALFPFHFFVFSIPFKNDQKTDAAKTQKMQKKHNLFFSVSAVVFTNSVPNFGGWVLKMQMFAENTMNKKKRPFNVKNESKLGPRLSQNLVQVCCAT